MGSAVSSWQNRVRPSFEKSQKLFVGWRTLTSDRILVPVLALGVFGVYLHEFVGSTPLDYYPGVFDLPVVALAGELLECPSLQKSAGRDSDIPLENLQGFSDSYYLDQRLGEPILALPFYNVLGALGFRVVFAFWRAALFVTAFLLCRCATGCRLASYVSSLALVFNPFLLSIKTINPNVPVLVLVGLSLYVAHRSMKHSVLALVSGGFAGMLFGVAHLFMAALALPALLTAQVIAAARRGGKKWLAAVLFTAGATVPVCFWLHFYSSLPFPLPRTIHVCVGDFVLVDATRSRGPSRPQSGPRQGEARGLREAMRSVEKVTDLVSYYWPEGKDVGGAGSGEMGLAGMPGDEQGIGQGSMRPMGKIPDVREELAQGPVGYIGEMPEGEQSFAQSPIGPGGMSPPEGSGSPIELCRREAGGWHIHRLGPFVISIWGMLNWPFHSKLVRSGTFPWPFMIFMPVAIAHSFGLLLFSAALLGVWALLRRQLDPVVGWGVLVFSLLLGAFLSVQENMGHYKYTYMLWMFLPVCVFAAAGLALLLDGFSKKWWIGYATVVCVTFLAGLAVCRFDFPLDQRWTRQFSWKGWNQEMLASEAGLAREKKEALSVPRLLPTWDVESMTLNVTPCLDKTTALDTEFIGKIHVSNTQTWLTDRAVSAAPDGSLVIVNPYLETGAKTLSDNDRCVVRAPTLKPCYRCEFASWFERLMLAVSGHGRSFYLVDSVVIPFADYIEKFERKLVHFNGYALVYRATWKEK